MTGVSDYRQETYTNKHYNKQQFDKMFDYKQNVYSSLENCESRLGKNKNFHNTNVQLTQG